MWLASSTPNRSASSRRALSVWSVSMAVTLSSLIAALARLVAWTRSPTICRSASRSPCRRLRRALSTTQ
ncbi:DUF620 domain-containing protein [Devosia sp. D6-9]|nr:DUF620 domain-containing protein [Devosia sp. D6-9]